MIARRDAVRLSARLMNQRMLIRTSISVGPVGVVSVAKGGGTTVELINPPETEKEANCAEIWASS